MEKWVQRRKGKSSENNKGDSGPRQRDHNSAVNSGTRRTSSSRGLPSRSSSAYGTRSDDIDVDDFSDAASSRAPAVRPMSSLSVRQNTMRTRPGSALGTRPVVRPHTAPGTRAEPSRLTEQRVREQVAAECERLAATPEGSVINQDISSAVSDTGGSWSQDLYMRLLNEDYAL